MSNKNSKSNKNEDDEQEEVIEISADEIKSDSSLSICDSPSTEVMLTMTGFADDQVGETLAACSDAEWDQSETAYSAQLLNVKKELDRVTVFAAPEKISEKTFSTIQKLKEQKRLAKPIINETEHEKADTKGIDSQFQPLAHLITEVMRVVLEDKENTEVEFRILSNHTYSILISLILLFLDRVLNALS